MVTIVLVEKTGELKSCKYANDTGDELYKKCKLITHKILKTSSI